jgi:predicted TIM-barrel fold metal-dependent hydrolase
MATADKIDHICKPDLSQNAKRDYFEYWAYAICRLARVPKTYMKISGCLRGALALASLGEQEAKDV